MTARRCPVCGTANSTCGPAGHEPTITFTTREKGAAVGELKDYDLEVNGVSTTLRLSDADAKKRGLTDTKSSTSSKARTPQNKARSAASKTAGGE